jgi:hypothetical protein
LDSKTVIRSGYGISVDPDNMRNQRNAYPSVINQDYSPASTYQFISYVGVPGSTQTPQVTLADGVPLPTYPSISVGTLKPATTASTSTYLPSTGTTTFAKNMNRGYIQSWNFFVQREITSTLSFETGYVGTHAVHTMTGVNINGSAPGTGNAGRQFYPDITSDMNSYEPFGDSTYHASQSRIKQRIGAGLVGVSYTYSHALDTNNGDNGDGTLFRAYPVSFRLDKATSGYDRTHTFQLYHVFPLPFGKGHHLASHGVAAQIFGGFQISGTLSRYSGLPFTVSASSSSLNAAGQSQTADQINPTVQILGGHDAFHPYFDGTAFAPITTARLGTSGRNLLRGPGVFTMNQSVSRTFTFKERFKLEILGEAFNLTNTPNFSNPGNTFATPTVTNGNITSYGNYSVISSVLTTQGVGPRILQVGGYLRF